MAPSIASYNVYIDSTRQKEFIALVSEKFGDAIELDYQDTQEV